MGQLLTFLPFHTGIAIKLFRDLNYDLFYLKYDSNAGDFMPLQHLPVHKAVVLGIVTTRHAQLEDARELKARVFQAADVIAKGQNMPREQVLKNNLAISPQCGFASMTHGVVSESSG